MNQLLFRKHADTLTSQQLVHVHIYIYYSHQHEDHVLMSQVPLELLRMWSRQRQVIPGRVSEVHYCQFTTKHNENLIGNISYTE